MRRNMTMAAGLRIAVAATLLAASPVVVAPSAEADPATDPCQLSVSFLCRFMPIAPELEGDIDLTQNQPPADPVAPLPEDRPLTDVCALGCV